MLWATGYIQFGFNHCTNRAYFCLLFNWGGEGAALSEMHKSFHTLTPHIKWAGDPSGNGFDISQTAWYKQNNWIWWNSSAPAEGNCWPDRTIPDHVIQQILVARHFSGRLETCEYCTHFQEEKRDFVENYHPISLLPGISKVLERCVLVYLWDHISHLIHREQHGFLAGKSCVTQRTIVLHYIGGQLNGGKKIDNYIYLDMSKAFNKVDRKLLGRLHQYSITGKLHNWFHSYLRDASNRLQFSEPLPENYQWLLGTTRVPARANIVSAVCGWSTKHCLSHQELPVRPMIPRFSRASIPSQTIMPCNLTVMILSVGPNHLGSP